MKLGRLFGTDGVRGEANVKLKPELSYRLGRAATLYFGKNSRGRILIGRDTRISGEMFESALVAGICSAGGRAILAGVIPTPGIAYLTRKHGLDAGIVISASHNPFRDNGIKFFGGDGFKLPDAVEDEIESLVHRIETNDDLPRPNGESIGRTEKIPNLAEEYIDFVASTTDVDLSNLKIVLDCANGAAYEIMPRVLRKLGADPIVIFASPDGINMNENCGSTHLEKLREKVLSEKADIGIAHDGDADRCLCIDERGNIIDGDHILIMCARAMNLDTVVTTVMANVGFHEAAKKFGLNVDVTKVGDRYVLESMKAHGYRLGGEQSGHIIFSDFSTTGDGLITALQILTAMKKSDKTAADLNSLMTTYPQVLINVRVKSKDGWDSNPKILESIRDGEFKLEGGRILVRPSGTEPLIRVMAEGKDRAQLEKICNEIAEVVKSELA